MSFMPESEIEKLRQFIRAVDANPKLLWEPKLAFFREYLLKMGAKVPEKEEPKKQEEEDRPKQEEPPKKEAEPEPMIEEEEEEMESDVELDMEGVIGEDRERLTLFNKTFELYCFKGLPQV